MQIKQAKNSNRIQYDFGEHAYVVSKSDICTLKIAGKTR